jgi:hypothetical protein
MLGATPWAGKKDRDAGNIQLTTGEVYADVTHATWWAWLLIAAVCWYLQLILTIQTDKGKGWVLRIIVILAMLLSAALGIIRFIKWVWHG